MKVSSLGDTDPQIIGALGAAIYAREQYLKENAGNQQLQSK